MLMTRRSQIVGYCTTYDFINIAGEEGQSD